MTNSEITEEDIVVQLDGYNSDWIVRLEKHTKSEGCGKQLKTKIITALRLLDKVEKRALGNYCDCGGCVAIRFYYNQAKEEKK